LSAAILAQTGAESVGDLRALTDADFAALDVPAMMRIYLKHLVRGTQSGRSVGKGGAQAANNSSANNATDWLVSLQNDFNYGQPFDMTLYAPSLSLLAGMGFEAPDALESLLITQCGSGPAAAGGNGVEPALELLVSTAPAARKEKRARVVEKLGRQAKAERSAADSAHAATALAAQQHRAADQRSAAGLAADASAAALLSVQGELSTTKALLSREKAARLAQQAALSSFLTDQLPLTLYREFLSSLLVKEYLLPVELSQLAAFRARHNITPERHAALLQSMGLMPAASPADASGALVVAQPPAAGSDPVLIEARLARRMDRNVRGGGVAAAGAALAAAAGGALAPLAAAVSAVANGSGAAAEEAPDMDCVVCLDRPKDHIILNCMHLCLCEECASSFSQAKGAAGQFSKNCPICSKKITQIARIYV
jgi:hypothetical protein